MSIEKVHRIRHIPNTRIVIDYWKNKKNNATHFVSVVKLHKEEQKSLAESDYKIYARQESAWYMQSFYKIDKNRFIILKLNEPTEISENGEKFTVTVFDANYCIGSCMFLFQGEFGNILFTNYFRPSLETSIFEYPVIQQLVEKHAIHTVYIDNSYASEKCTFPSRKNVIAATISLIKSHPKHKIILSKEKFGKEEVILAIAKALKVKMFVSENTFQFYRCLDAQRYFTNNPKDDKFTLLDYILKPGEFKKIESEKGMCIAIVFTGLYHNLKSQSPKIITPHFHIMPYSSHCNHAELMEFLSRLRPQEIKPILSDDRKPIFEIPKCMLDLCYVPSDSMFPLDSDFDGFSGSHEDNNEKTLIQNKDAAQPVQKEPGKIRKNSSVSIEEIFTLKSSTFDANKESTDVERELVIKLVPIELINEKAKQQLAHLKSLKISHAAIEHSQMTLIENRPLNIRLNLIPEKRSPIARFQSCDSEEQDDTDDQGSPFLGFDTDLIEPNQNSFKNLLQNASDIGENEVETDGTELLSSILSVPIDNSEDELMEHPSIGTGEVNENDITDVVPDTVDDLENVNKSINQNETCVVSPIQHTKDSSNPVHTSSESILMDVEQFPAHVIFEVSENSANSCNITSSSPENPVSSTNQIRVQVGMHYSADGESSNMKVDSYVRKHSRTSSTVDDTDSCRRSHFQTEFEDVNEIRVLEVQNVSGFRKEENVSISSPKSKRARSGDDVRIQGETNDCEMPEKENTNSAPSKSVRPTDDLRLRHNLYLFCVFNKKELEQRAKENFSNFYF